MTPVIYRCSFITTACHKVQYLWWVRTIPPPTSCSSVEPFPLILAEQGRVESLQEHWELHCNLAITRPSIETLEPEAPSILNPEQSRTPCFLLASFPASRAEGTGKLILENSGVLWFLNIFYWILEDNFSVFLVNITFFGIPWVHNNCCIAFVLPLYYTPVSYILQVLEVLTK